MSSSINWLAILIVFVAPLVLGVGLMLAGLRFRAKWARWAAGTSGLLFLLAFAVAMVWFAPYMWALHLESKWSQAKPKTKAELESFLALYSQREIPPTQSEWGRNHELQDGEHMTRYLLLWSAPLDVVYTSNHNIVAIYTSYE